MSPSSSLLDSALTLYQETTGAGGVTREVIARNDDYYSSDSWLEMWLDAGTYYVAVTSTGNEGFDPETDDTGFGGTTEGLYHLNLVVRGGLGFDHRRCDTDASGRRFRRFTGRAVSTSGSRAVPRFLWTR